MKIYVSGIHSGPDPSSGLGVARSLKIAFPQATLIGVDYSPNSSGIHFEGFDDVWLQRPWNELDLDLFHGQIVRVLDEGALWISCLDIEAIWLARNFPQDPRLLLPGTAALAGVAKPAIPAARHLPVRIAPYISSARPAWELHAFCRRHGWPIWCKGPVHEARSIWNWPEAIETLKYFREKWKIAHPVLQAHVSGREESIVFSAYQGKLLDCVHMRKSAQTAEGKTWAGANGEVPAFFAEPLQKVLAEYEWSGGGELEMVRDDLGELYLIDWNPRFPAWIFGTTLAGRNLPALLVEATGAGQAGPTPCISREFSRVVMELPVRLAYPLPLQAHPGLDQLHRPGKHPSGMVLLGRRLGGKPVKAESPPPVIPGTFLADLAESDPWQLRTPRRIILPKTARATFRQAAILLNSLQDSGVAVRIGYSVKTNPHPGLMALARESGFMAEVITGHEFRHATACGFPPQGIIVNGPAQSWPEELPAAEPPYAVFADSFERLAALLEMDLKPRYLGLRLNPTPIASRFGLDLAEFGEFAALIDLLKGVEKNQALGLHFHMASDVVGVKPWRELYAAALHWGRAIQQRSGLAVACVDVGGGWFPEDFFENLVPALPGMIREARALLPNLESFVLEPGKALAQPSMALITRVLEVRRPRAPHGKAEALVDGAISDLPQSPNYPHRVLALFRDGEQMILPGGEGRLLGRNCMEFDILATNIGLPSRLAAGDLLVFCDAGAYDASMAYQFGLGGTKDA